jgi:hypothetical protein
MWKILFLKMEVYVNEFEDIKKATKNNFSNL